MTCRLAKSHRLPFALVEHCTVSALEQIHSDVWQSPVLSHKGFKYYVSFTDDFLSFYMDLSYKTEVGSLHCNLQF